MVEGGCGRCRHGGRGARGDDVGTGSAGSGRRDDGGQQGHELPRRRLRFARGRRLRAGEMAPASPVDVLHRRLGRAVGRRTQRTERRRSAATGLAECPGRCLLPSGHRHVRVPAQRRQRRQLDERDLALHAAQSSVRAAMGHPDVPVEPRARPGRTVQRVEPGLSARAAFRALRDGKQRTIPRRDVPHADQRRHQQPGPGRGHSVLQLLGQPLGRHGAARRRGLRDPVREPVGQHPRRPHARSRATSPSATTSPRTT